MLLRGDLTLAALHCRQLRPAFPDRARGATSLLRATEVTVVMTDGMIVVFGGPTLPAPRCCLFIIEHHGWT